MKYKNTQKAIIILGDRDSIQPFAVTRDFTPEEVKSLSIESQVRNGQLVHYNGPDRPVEKSPSPRSAEWTTEMPSGKSVKKKTSTGATVEYVVADSGGSDAIAMSDPDTVTSLDGRQASDYIEEGVDAREYNRNASEAQDAQFDAENDSANTDSDDTLAENEHERNNIVDVDEDLAKHAKELAGRHAQAPTQEPVQGIETEDGKGSMVPDKTRTASAAQDEAIAAEQENSDFNDEDTLAENEQHVPDIADADDEIAKDVSQTFVKNSGAKGGSQPKPVNIIVEETVTKALDELEESQSKSYDDEEMAHDAPSRIVQFLKQNFPAKKWVIAKETDKVFLRAVAKITKSSNIRSLISQRISELPKEEVEND